MVMTVPAIDLFTSIGFIGRDLLAWSNYVKSSVLSFRCWRSGLA